MSLFTKGTAKAVTLLFFIVLFPHRGLWAQTSTIGEFKDENSLYAETKQVNQFFRRFNNEESVSGDRYYQKDSLYRNPHNRKRYLDILFDLEAPGITESLRKDFIRDVSSEKKPRYIDFHGGNWFAEVHSIFNWQGHEESLILFLQLQEEKIGSKWIISGVKFDSFDKLFNKDTSGIKYFLHPMSHEIEFMNLQRVFKDNRKNVESYTSDSYEPDILSLFLYEIKRGNLTFKTISKVKFHFLQIPDWYFEISYFNRSGNNTGWLISGLKKVNEPDKTALEKKIKGAHD